MRADFRGTVLAWGRQNRGREHSLNPVTNCSFQLLSYFFFPTCKDDAKEQKVSIDLLSIAFLDGRWVSALAFTRPTRSLFTFSEQLVPVEVCGNESQAFENEQCYTPTRM